MLRMLTVLILEKIQGRPRPRKKMGNKLGVVVDLQIWNGKLDLLMSIGLLHQALPNVTTFFLTNKISSYFFSCNFFKFSIKLSSLILMSWK